jgi:hypothetical protein
VVVSVSGVWRELDVRERLVRVTFTEGGLVLKAT